MQMVNDLQHVHLFLFLLAVYRSTLAVCLQVGSFIVFSPRLRSQKNRGLVRHLLRYTTTGTITESDFGGLVSRRACICTVSLVIDPCDFSKDVLELERCHLSSFVAVPTKNPTTKQVSSVSF
jgi:hypothetical protein